MATELRLLMPTSVRDINSDIDIDIDVVSSEGWGGVAVGIEIDRDEMT